MLWCVKQYPLHDRGIHPLISWSVVCWQLLVKSLPRKDLWQKGAALPKAACLPRNNLHPVIGQFKGTEVWLTCLNSGYLCGATAACELFVGLAEALLHLFRSSTSSSPPAGFPHCPSDVFPERTPYTNFYLRIYFLGDQINMPISLLFLWVRKLRHRDG